VREEEKTVNRCNNYRYAVWRKNAKVKMGKQSKEKGKRTPEACWWRFKKTKSNYISRESNPGHSHGKREFYH
jgi:hypothetical protein